MIYDQKITLEQAIDLQNKIKAGEMPDILYIDSESNEAFYLSKANIDYIYQYSYIYLTRPDYAQYIKGNKPLPDGYGYASKPLDSGIYDNLECLNPCNSNKSWKLKFQTSVVVGCTSYNNNYWWRYAFPLTDLARVEAEAEPKPSMPAHFADSADWKAKYEAQAAELDEIRTRLRRSSDEVSERKEMLGELKLQLQEATASADSKQQTIEATTKVNNELGDCLRAARDYIEKLEQLGNTQTLLERHTKEKEFAQSAYYETLPF